jgi:hypothetical protein
MSFLGYEAAAAGGDEMLVKALFWGAVLCAAIGMNAPDGNLFFFCAAHLTMLTIGLSLLRRERRTRGGSAPKAAVPRAAAAATKAKAA